MRISFERTGGFMGLKSSLVIDLVDLPIDQAQTLRGFLDDANFFTLPENLPTHPIPDGFHYLITVETETIKHTVRARDATAPEELRPLLQALSQRAKPQRN
jgi:hypothetical protein